MCIEQFRIGNDAQGTKSVATLIKTLFLWMTGLSKRRKNLKRAFGIDFMSVLTDLSVKFDKKEIVYIRTNPFLDCYMRRMPFVRGIKYQEVVRHTSGMHEFEQKSDDSLYFAVAPSKRKMQFFCEHRICVITLADVLAAHDNPGFLTSDLPLLISTIENCYQFVSVYGTSRYALRIRDYLESNTNIAVKEAGIARQSADDEPKPNTKRDGIVLVIDLLPPGSIQAADPAIYWIDLLHRTITDSSKDIICNIIPELQDKGINILYVTSPNRFAFPKWPIVFVHMLRYDNIKERNQHKATQQTFRLFRRSEMSSEYCGMHVNTDKGFPQITARGEFINYENGYRITVGNRANSQNRVFLFGPCVVAGAYVEDRETIPSILQAFVGSRYSVINRGACNDMGENLIMRSVTYHRGDVAIVFIDKHALQKWGTDQCPQYDLTNSYKKIARLDKHISDSPYHCDAVVNKQLAHDLFDHLSAKGFLNKDTYSRSPVSFGSPLKRIPRFHIEKYSALYAWQKQFADYRRAGKNGAIVMNCNPFTLGHKYLIETAAQEVDHLYIFVVQEDKSYFSFEDRFGLVKEGVKDITNAIVLPSGRYMISSDTLPGYFTKEMVTDTYLDASYDMELFMQVAAFFGIVVRYVGKEPYDEFTRQYNENMKAILPIYGISVIEIERKMICGKYISASLVRKCIEKQDYKALLELVPISTYQYIEKRYQSI